MDDFFEALNNIYRDADHDPELRHWFKHLNAFIRCVSHFRGRVAKSNLRTVTDSAQEMPA